MVWAPLPFSPLRVSWYEGGRILAGRHVSSRSERIVALLPPGAAAPELPDWAQVVVTTSGYEAAAELLVAPTSALLVDLGRISPPHKSLLAMADKLAVPIVAFGTVSATLDGDPPAHMHLVTRESAVQTLTDLLAAGPLEPLQAEYVPAPVATGGPARQDQPPTPPAGATKPADRPTRTSELLTEEELKALLENQP